MRDIYLVNCCRTAVGSMGGSLKDTPAPELGAIVIKEALKRAGVDLTSAEPFERTMKLFEDRLAEGERLWGLNAAKKER